MEARRASRLVDPRGFEPRTFRLPVCRAPNCATGPRHTTCRTIKGYRRLRRSSAAATISDSPNQKMQTREISARELMGGGYMALADGPGPHPGVVVIHEAYGLNDQINDVTRRP